MERLKEIFKELKDPRIERCKVHLLEDILLLTLIAVICGAESYESIELFGKSKLDFLRTIMPLPNGIPSHDTLERLFKRLDSSVFETAFLRWTSTLSQNSEGRIISIDGKTLRGSQDTVNGKYAIHLVSAWSSANSMVLAQIKTEGKCNEIKATQELLSLLDITNSVVTIDAMGCQRATAQHIVDGQADYILAVKQNQSNLYQSIEDSFNRQVPTHVVKDINKDHGRIETRICSIITDLRWIDQRADWMKLNTIIKIESTRAVGEKTSTETRYYISSLNKDAAYFNQSIRQHWHIENSLHWVMDVQFREDEARKRKDNAAENFAIIRRIALNKLKNIELRRLGIHNKRLVAAWDNKFLLKIILN